MSEPYVIPSNALFDDEALCEKLGMKVGSLDRARKAGELRFTRRGGRTLYLGAWIQEWLTRDETRQEATTCA